jgi:hypothetical protein
MPTGARKWWKKVATDIQYRRNFAIVVQGWAARLANDKAE